MTETQQQQYAGLKRIRCRPLKIIVVACCYVWMVSGNISSSSSSSSRGDALDNIIIEIELEVNNDDIIELERGLLPRSGDGSSSSSGSSNYTGCLSMTYDELQSSWNFPGEMPACTGGVSETGSYTSSSSTSFTSFDIAACDTYSNVWLWDLALTCEDLSTLEGCKCTFADEYLYLGNVSCATSASSSYACPAECSVCQTCMMLLGCDDIYTQPMSGVANYLPYLVASAVGLGVTALLLYSNNRKSNGIIRRRRALKGLDRNVAVAVDKGYVPTTNNVAFDKEENHVWLAPMII